MIETKRLGLTTLGRTIQVQTQAELYRIVRYAISGAITAIFFFLTIYLAVDWFVLSIPSATALGWAVAVPMNFLIHKIWSFESARSYSHSIPRYILAFTCGFAVNLAITEGLVRLFWMHYLLAQLLATPVLLAINYGTLRLWVFRSRPQPPEAGGVKPAGCVDMPSV